MFLFGFIIVKKRYSENVDSLIQNEDFEDFVRTVLFQTSNVSRKTMKQ